MKPLETKLSSYCFHDVIQLALTWMRGAVVSGDVFDYILFGETDRLAYKPAGYGRADGGWSFV